MNTRQLAQNRRHRLLGSVVIGTGLWLAGISGASAQCELPDQLDDGGCCSPVELVLPTFPAFDQECSQICWQDCDVDATDVCVAVFNAPTDAAGATSGGGRCGRSRIRVRLFDTGGTLKWRGRLRMTYSRTFFEADVDAGDHQVWRFLLNGDLRPTAAAGSPPCEVPTCAATFNRVRFTGYLDYARNCDTGVFSNAWMLHHSCDRIDHQPGFPRGGGSFHPDRTYTFVGPSAGFVIDPTIVAEGGGGASEAVRRLRVSSSSSGPVSCVDEEPVDHFLSVSSEGCLCGTGTGTPQYLIGGVSYTGACGSWAQTPGGPWLPGYVSMGVGMWTDPLVYPGVEALRWSTGNYEVGDACSGTSNPEMFFGVTTIGGWDAFAITVAGVGGFLSDTFLDQGNAVRSGGPILNVRYQSERILNFNH